MMNGHAVIRYDSELASEAVIPSFYSSECNGSAFNVSHNLGKLYQRVFNSSIRASYFVFALQKFAFYQVGYPNDMVMK